MMHDAKYTLTSRGSWMLTLFEDNADFTEKPTDEERNAYREMAYTYGDTPRLHADEIESIRSAEEAFIVYRTLVGIQRQILVDHGINPNNHKGLDRFRQCESKLDGWLGDLAGISEVMI